MSLLFLLFDARADPVSPVPWGALILLLAIVFVLAVGGAVDLVQASQDEGSCGIVLRLMRRVIRAGQTNPRRLSLHQSRKKQGSQ